MKRFAIALSVFMLSCLLVVAAEYCKGQDLVASTPEQATYKIKVSFNGYGGVSTGNGTAISPCHILTAAHIFSPPKDAGLGVTIKDIVVYQPNGFQWKVLIDGITEWKKLREDDLALLKTGIGSEPLAFVPLETDTERLESEANFIRIIGYALDQDFLDTKTARLIRNAYIQNTYTADTDIDDGISGCGLFSKNDKLMGVVWGHQSGSAHAVPLTNIISWQRMKLYQQTPYGTFQSGRYRSLELGFRKKTPLPGMQLYYGPMQPQPYQQQQPQQPNIQQGTPTAPKPTLTNPQTSRLQPIPVQVTQCGGCDSGGGMMGGGQQMFMPAQPQQMQMQMQMPSAQIYDPNQSPYATRQTQPPPRQAAPPAQQQQVAQQPPKAEKVLESSPCSCDEESVLNALNDVACSCSEQDLETKFKGIRDDLQSLSKKVDDSARPQSGDKACEEKLKALENDIGDSIGQIAEAVNGLSSRQEALAQQIADLGTERPEPVSTGNNQPTPAAPPTGNPTEASPLPELLYLTANNCKECKKTDEYVRELRRDGVKIRVVVLTARQYTGFNDVPRLTVFKEEQKPENYFGSSKITGYLASLR